MVRIRLRRVGGKKQASFRVVAAEKESPRNGRFIEILGFYNPRTEPATISLKEDRIYHWISNGAQPSDSAMQAFKVAGLPGGVGRFQSGENGGALMAGVGLEGARAEGGRGSGRNGRWANALRILLQVPAARDGKRAFLQIADPE